GFKMLGVEAGPIGKTSLREFPQTRAEPGPLSRDKEHVREALVLEPPRELPGIAGRIGPTDVAVGGVDRACLVVTLDVITALLAHEEQSNIFVQMLVRVERAWVIIEAAA